MPQVQGQYQVQKEAQLLRLSPLQLMTTRLLELPIVELEQRVKDESIDNIALETDRSNASEEDFGNRDEDFDQDSADEIDTIDGERADETDDREVSIDDYADSDELPVFQPSETSDRQERPLGETLSFVDDLMRQMIDYGLNDHQRELVEYLIYSLNDNGYIEASLSRIADEMLFHHNIQTDETELEEALHILQQFDPAGIGARDTRECLLLQLERKMNDREHLIGEKYFLLEDAHRLIAEHYDLFVNNNVEKLKTVMNLSAARLRVIFEELRKLNLHPGLALTESAKDRVQSAIPDFIVETDENGQIDFRLNRGDLPELFINREYAQQLKEYQTSKRKLSRSEQDFVTYIQRKIEAAKLFIEAIVQRQNTLKKTMAAIIQLQHTFFLTQDPNDLQPLVLKDVAEKAGFDISTVSRVRNSKYCLLNGRIYPLSYFFKHPRSNAQGTAIDADRVRDRIRQLVAEEEKAHPLSDQQICDMLNKMGFEIKRRTVAKYRDEIGIPPLQKRQSI